MMPRSAILNGPGGRAVREAITAVVDAGAEPAYPERVRCSRCPNQDLRFGTDEYGRTVECCDRCGLCRLVPRSVGAPAEPDGPRAPRPTGSVRMRQAEARRLRVLALVPVGRAQAAPIRVLRPLVLAAGLAWNRAQEDLRQLVNAGRLSAERRPVDTGGAVGVRWIRHYWREA